MNINHGRKAGRNGKRRARINRGLQLSEEIREALLAMIKLDTGPCDFRFTRFLRRGNLRNGHIATLLRCRDPLIRRVARTAKRLDGLWWWDREIRKDVLSLIQRPSWKRTLDRFNLRALIQKHSVPRHHLTLASAKNAKKRRKRSYKT